MLQCLQVIQDALSSFDGRDGTFILRDVREALRLAVPDHREVHEEYRQGSWAEWAAFAFTRDRGDAQRPWSTYFQPEVWRTDESGVLRTSPDCASINESIIEYWVRRASVAKHPVLVARYADLAWDMRAGAGEMTKRSSLAECACKAIDSYIAATARDSGEAWEDSVPALKRAMQLACAIKDKERIAKAVDANLDYVARTAQDHLIGTYCYIIEHLTPPNATRLPALAEAQMVKMMESRFARITDPACNTGTSVDGLDRVGTILAGYYGRRGMRLDQHRVLVAVAQVQERASGACDPIAKLIRLERARHLYLEAGERAEADRVQHFAQTLSDEVEGVMETITSEMQIPRKVVDDFVNAFVKDGIDRAMSRFAIQFVPQQGKVKAVAEECDRRYIHRQILPVSIYGDGHTIANVNDERGDPDGRLVYETAEYVSRSHAPWMSAVVQQLVKDGMTPEVAVAFLSRSPLFETSRIPILEEAVRAHIAGDFVKAIHLAIPQVEHAGRVLLFLTGRPSNKAHQSGRGVMQAKGLSDILDADEWPVSGERGEDLRMYLLAVLAHPKGLNIRNTVAHGLWTSQEFTRVASERVLHAMFSLTGIQIPSPAKDRDSLASVS